MSYTPFSKQDQLLNFTLSKKLSYKRSYRTAKKTSRKANKLHSDTVKSMCVDMKRRKSKYSFFYTPYQNDCKPTSEKFMNFSPVDDRKRWKKLAEFIIGDDFTQYKRTIRYLHKIKYPKGSYHWRLLDKKLRRRLDKLTRMPNVRKTNRMMALKNTTTIKFNFSKSESVLKGLRSQSRMTVDLCNNPKVNKSNVSVDVSSPSLYSKEQESSSKINVLQPYFDTLSIHQKSINSRSANELSRNSVIQEESYMSTSSEDESMLDAKIPTSKDLLRIGNNDFMRSTRKLIKMIKKESNMDFTRLASHNSNRKSNCKMHKGNKRTQSSKKFKHYKPRKFQSFAKNMLGLSNKKSGSSSLTKSNFKSRLSKFFSMNNSYNPRKRSVKVKLQRESGFVKAHKDCKRIRNSTTIECGYKSLRKSLFMNEMGVHLENSSRKSVSSLSAITESSVKTEINNKSKPTLQLPQDLCGLVYTSSASTKTILENVPRAPQGLKIQFPKHYNKVERSSKSLSENGEIKEELEESSLAQASNVIAKGVQNKSRFIPNKRVFSNDRIFQNNTKSQFKNTDKVDDNTIYGKNQSKIKVYKSPPVCKPLLRMMKNDTKIVSFTSPSSPNGEKMLKISRKVKMPKQLPSDAIVAKQKDYAYPKINHSSEEIVKSMFKTSNIGKKLITRCQKPNMSFKFSQNFCDSDTGTKLSNTKCDTEACFSPSLTNRPKQENYTKRSGCKPKRRLFSPKVGLTCYSPKFSSRKITVLNTGKKLNLSNVVSPSLKTKNGNFYSRALAIKSPKHKIVNPISGVKQNRRRDIKTPVARNVLSPISSPTSFQTARPQNFRRKYENGMCKRSDNIIDKRHPISRYFKKPGVGLNPTSTLNCVL